MTTAEASFGIGHNSQNAPEEEGLSLRAAKLAQVSLEFVARWVGRQDPATVMMKRQGGDKLTARQVWVYVMRNQIQQVEFAEITQLYRGTIGDDQERIRQWVARNGFVAEYMSMLEDHLEPLAGLLDAQDDIMYELTAEKEADAAARRAIDLVREAAKTVEKPTAASMRRAEVALLHESIEKRRQEARDAQQARIDAAVAAAEKPKRTARKRA